MEVAARGKGRAAAHPALRMVGGMMTRYTVTN
jgi:hypothetical protein